VSSIQPTLFLVGRRDDVGRKHILLHFDGALVCDCKLFHQHRFWCKHAFCLVASNIVSFNVSTALDQSYASLVAMPQVRQDQMVNAPSIAEFSIDKPVSWGSDNLKQDFSERSGLTIASDANESSEVSKREFVSTTRRQRMYSAIATANSDPHCGQLADKFLEELDALVKARAQANQMNLGKVHLNPLSIKRNKVELATNKTKPY
jgi:hypothetical protein